MRASRDEIRDAGGRRVTVVRSKLPRKDGAPKVVEREPVEIVKELDELASLIRRMSPPLSSNPERFHEDKSEIGRRLSKVSERCRRAFGVS